jgi:hypothetical protein
MIGMRKIRAFRVSAPQWMKLAAVVATALLPLSAQSDNKTATAGETQGDFFIVSSVDLSKKQILLKLPTEVTELIQVDGNTRYFDERGKPLKLGDLRSGDTVYIASTHTGGPPLAISIHRGPMTLDILRQHYLRSKQ